MQKNYLYLKDFAAVINAEYKPGDKIGVASSASSNATNLPFYTQKKIDFMPDISTYLQQKSRVFLIIPEDQLQDGARVLQRKAGWLLVSNR
ncbi:MAG: hypothetical protein K6U80_18980 [Firmicutes bacterium]|nr:hypothetical protein [Bacillota bacterium]